MIAAMIYLLCACTSLLCTWKLARACRRAPSRLLAWSAACFVGLTLRDVLLVVDRLLLPDVNLYPLRLAIAFASVLLLVFGLVWEDD